MATPSSGCPTSNSFLAIAESVVCRLEDDVDAETLYRSMRELSREKARLYAPHINEAMLRGNITTLRRAQYFLAQLAHESVGLVYFEEIASGAQYEGRRDLGNTQPGDGRRFKGRGPIQLTGRANYRGFGRWLGDADKFTDDPKLVATPKYGFLAALYYWSTRDLNSYCDRGDFRGLTRRINGGYNGLADRYRRLAYVKRLGAKILPERPDPLAVLTTGERKAVEQLEHERRRGAKEGWGSATDLSSPKAKATGWKAKIRSVYMPRLRALGATGKNGNTRNRRARYDLLKEAHGGF